MPEANGWDESADAWIQFVEEGDINRDLLLDPIMLDLCGNANGLTVLDAGCGEGRFARMLSKRGARVIGIDPTIGLLLHGKSKPPHVEYILADAESLPFATNSFDLVISYIVLVDIGDYRRAIAEMERVLRPGGRLIVSNLNGFTSAVTAGWFVNEDGERTHYMIDRYLEERGELVEWRGIRIVNYHRPLSSYMNAFLEPGLILERFDEPGPTDQAIAMEPRLASYRRVPFFFVARWRKPG